MCPRISVAGYNGATDGETQQVRLSNELYTYEETHKVIKDGRIIPIAPTTLKWDRCPPGMCSELWQKNRSMTEAWRRLESCNPGSISDVSTTAEWGGSQH